MCVGLSARFLSRKIHEEIRSTSNWIEVRKRTGVGKPAIVEVLVAQMRAEFDEQKYFAARHNDKRPMTKGLSLSRVCPLVVFRSRAYEQV